MLWNQQHWRYIHYILIPSEPEHFCLDKLIAEALPLLEAPTVVRSVYLYKLLCGVNIDCSWSPNAPPLRACLRQETRKTLKELCEGSFVVYAPVRSVVRMPWAAQITEMDGCNCDLPPNRQPFLSHYGELQYADVSSPVNKDTGSQFGLV